MRAYTYIADTTATLQDFLRNVEGYSTTIIRRLKHYPDDVSVNGSFAKMVDMVNPGDKIRIAFTDEPCNIPPNFEISAKIAFEDDDIIVYDKPGNMPVHPSIRHKHDTLANVFSAHCKTNNITAPFRVINRLDRDTTGLCIVAKTPLVAFCLSKGLKKEYTAVCQGTLEQKVGTINAPIARAGESIILRKISPDGSPSVTHYTVLQETENASLVRLILETGRTHQIRVHFSYIGHPLLGDELYGGDLTTISRQALHCSRLSFTHPITKNEIDLHSDIPEDMRACLN